LGIAALNVYISGLGNFISRISRPAEFGFVDESRQYTDMKMPCSVGGYTLNALQRPSSVMKRMDVLFHYCRQQMVGGVPGRSSALTVVNVGDADDAPLTSVTRECRRDKDKQAISPSGIQRRQLLFDNP
jgi:hypothetical protein